MKMKITAAVLTLSILLAAFSGCGAGGSSSGAGSTAGSGSSGASSAAVAETAGSSAPAEADLSNPEIVIEFGDFEGIQQLMKKMGNFEVPEGTVIRITGMYYKLTSTPSVMEENEAGDERLGLQIHSDDALEELPDRTKIEVTGTAVKAQLTMEFHVSADGFVVLDS